MADLQPFLRVLEQRGASTACPCCGAFDWASASERMLIHSYDQDDQISLGRGYSVIALICDNCGFVRQHFMPVLEAALSQEGQAPAKQDEKSDNH